MCQYCEIYVHNICTCGDNVACIEFILGIYTDRCLICTWNNWHIWHIYGILRGIIGGTHGCRMESKSCSLVFLACMCNNVGCTCCTLFWSFWLKDCSGAIDNTFCFMWCQHWCKWFQWPEKSCCTSFDFHCPEECAGTIVDTTGIT